MIDLKPGDIFITLEFKEIGRVTKIQNGMCYYERIYPDRRTSVFCNTSLFHEDCQILTPELKARVL